MSQYQEAETYVCDVVEDLIMDGDLSFPSYTFADAVGSFSRGVKQVTHRTAINPDGAAAYLVDESAAAFIVGFAQDDYRFFDLCIDIVSTNVAVGAQMPSPLRHFAASVLRNQFKRPSPRHRPRKANWLEKNFLFSLTQQVTDDFQLTITRNDVPHPDSATAYQSACDAVANGLTVCGRQTKYHEIKNLMVHPDNARLRSEFRAAGRIWRRGKTDLPGNALRPDYWDHRTELTKSDARDIWETFTQNK